MRTPRPRFTEHAQQALDAAQEEAAAAGAGQIGLRHLLLGLAGLQEGAAASLLQSMGLTVDALRSSLAAAKQRPGPRSEGRLDAEARRAIEVAHQSALMDACERIGSEHLLRGILDVRESPVAELLGERGLTIMPYETSLAPAREAGRATSNPGWALEGGDHSTLGSVGEALVEAESPSAGEQATPEAAETPPGPAEPGAAVGALLAANRQFLAGGRPRPVEHGAAKGLAILTCIDPRLNDFVGPALGLGRGDAYILRNAGARIAGNDDVIRSLCVAVHLGGVSQIVVLGHTDCAMNSLDVYRLTTAMGEHGIARDAIPSMDLRGWLGAFGDLRMAVLETVGTIRESPLIPASVGVYGMVIDTDTGEVTPLPS